MYDKMIEHIKRKLHEKDEILDDYDIPTDEQVKYYMLATFEIVENECRKCFYCKNYRRFTRGLLCKMACWSEVHGGNQMEVENYGILS
nr:hypothetical protein [uncultured Methanobrevibacter sp.]